MPKRGPTGRSKGGPRRRPALVPFGQRVRELRTERRLSQEALAIRADLHPTYIGGIERAERNPTVLSLLKIAGALEVDPGDLLRKLRP